MLKWKQEKWERNRRQKLKAEIVFFSQFGWFELRKTRACPFDWKWARENEKIIDEVKENDIEWKKNAQIEEKLNVRSHKVLLRRNEFCLSNKDSQYSKRLGNANWNFFESWSTTCTILKRNSSLTYQAKVIVSKENERKRWQEFRHKFNPKVRLEKPEIYLKKKMEMLCPENPS